MNAALKQIQSETPRTDAVIDRSPYSYCDLDRKPLCDLARNLELENARLRAALSELVAERDNEFHHDTEGFNMARAALAGGAS
jgi:hypothetical protein